MATPRRPQSRGRLLPSFATGIIGGFPGERRFKAVDGLRHHAGTGCISPSKRNEFVRQRIGALRSANLRRPRVRVLGVVPETATPCRCAAPKGFFLFTTFLHIELPLWCIGCNGIVPLYRLPLSPTGEHSGLLAWKSNYQACDALQNDLHSW
ncbi:MAG: Zn-ribbon-containing protein [Acidobacteriia bacterium]|nr:Zn-ribbon-containing protein [Terriglobia bacterium]